MSKQTISRRRFIALSVAGATAGTFAQRVAHAERQPLTSEDPMAIALEYIEDASTIDAAKNPIYKPGSDCSNCGQFKNIDTEALGECALFPGKAVKSTAWCKAWVK